MTEEIIIDGVNVAGCEHYTTMEDCDGIHDLCEQLDDYCSTKKNCYYKQLIRLEQENKKLKKDVQLFKCLDTFGESECRCACRCLGNEFCEDADKKIEKYRSALEDIREILIICKEFRTCERCKFYKECNKDLEGCITDKINEVLTP